MLETVTSEAILSVRQQPSVLRILSYLFNWDDRHEYSSVNRDMCNTYIQACDYVPLFIIRMGDNPRFTQIVLATARNVTVEDDQALDTSLRMNLLSRSLKYLTSFKQSLPYPQDCYSCKGLVKKQEKDQFIC